MKIELIDTTRVLLEGIDNPRMTRNIVAKTYALALLSSEPTDWIKVNRAIVERWSHHALEWIKERAWSGRCFAKLTEESK